MPGAGKSTLAVALGRVLGVPVFHLDAAYGRAWPAAAERDAFDAHVRRVIAAPEGVVDGNYSSHLLAERIARADAVVVVTTGRRVALWRVVRRAMRERRARPGAGATGNPKGLSREFLVYIWRWERNHRGFVEEVRRHAAGTPVLLVRRRRDAARVLERAARR
jgi:adenylate kinase family enzyme